jgi:Transmembrane domain of unknown function (DUF3566)
VSEPSERTGSGSDQPTGGNQDHRTDDETTSAFVSNAVHDPSELETTAHLERPVMPPGSPTPPWQRVQPLRGVGGSGGSLGGSHDGTESSADHYTSPYRPGPAMPDHLDHPTMAQQRPSYVPPVQGSPNGSPVQNPYPAVPEPQGPPPVHPGQPVAPGGTGGPGGPGSSGGPGASSVGGPTPPAQQSSIPSARPTARPSAAARARAVRAPRKASLQVRRLDPWSVLKLSLVLSVAMFLMWLVAIGVLYGVLDGMGVWDKLNGAYSDLASVNDESGGGEPLISAGRVFAVSAVVGVVNIVLFTAFVTVSAFVYNVSADLAGGVEVTLSERD